MNWMKGASLLLGILGLGLGLQAAYLWREASKVAIIPTFMQFGDGLQPTDPSIASNHWIVGILEYASESGRLNSSAAKWTAVAVLCSSLSGVIGMFS